MADFRVAYTDPYGFGRPKPYLGLQVAGPSGTTWPIIGLVDSGADSTCLPHGYASLLGFGEDDLEADEGISASGSMKMWRGTKRLHAHVGGLDELPFEPWPVFLLDCQQALWGRAGLFETFAITFEEELQSFTMRPTKSALSAGGNGGRWLG